MDVFVYSRDAPTAGALRDDVALAEQHWSYMDRFADSMIARGPTLGPDPEIATGSLHVLGLPSVEAARAFVADEPNNCAGVYAEHDIWRFENLLDRTMWEFTGSADGSKFLVIARSTRAVRPPSFVPGERLILYGALSTLEDATPAGFALALQAFDEEDVRRLLEDGGLQPDGPGELKIRPWAFGGRPPGGRLARSHELE